MARLDDGFSTKISFAADPTILMYEKTVTPPGVSGGGPNDTTTMRNTAWRTMKPKKLKTLTAAAFTAAYDPATYDEVVNNLVNVNTLITLTFSDNSTLAFYGWLNEFTPNEIQEGEQPTAGVSIEVSNEDNSTPPVETAPNYTAPP